MKNYRVSDQTEFEFMKEARRLDESKGIKNLLIGAPFSLVAAGTIFVGYFKAIDVAQYVMDNWSNYF